jgi:hypothetical protein
MDNNTEQALNMLVSAARQARLSYDEHAALEQAVQSLLQTLQPEEDKSSVKAKVKAKSTTGSD